VVFAAVLLVTMIIGIALFLFQGQNYLAEVRHSEGINLFQKGEVDRAINSIQKATSLNPSIDIYWRDLAQLYLFQANQILASKEPILEEDDISRVISIINNGIYSTRYATNNFSFNVANWNVAGYFYRNLVGVEGSEPKISFGDMALESYSRAAELEPASPFSYGEMGRVYILMAQNFRAKLMEKEAGECLSRAITILEKSIELKLDYIPAYYLKAVAYDQQGREKEAVAELEEAKKMGPQDVEISFQLGILYWRTGELDKAQKEFEGITELYSDYSNARYMLGLVYDKKEEKEKAREQFEKLNQLNPDNQEVIKILENLREGLPALEGITVSSKSPTEEIPLEEIPPEIQW
jgi:tetratricopeptide (TPR) repeat protein